MHPYLSKIKAHLFLHGIFGASVAIAVACVDKLGFSFASTDGYARFFHTRFDKKMGVQTAESNEHLEVDVPAEMHQDARSYEASPAVELFQILESFSIDSRMTFIDIGCGKGKAMLIASFFPFGKLEGIDLSNKLVAQCSDNLKQSDSLSNVQMPDYDVFCRNAVEYDFPETDLLIYLFNPFGLTVLQQVLEKLQASLEDCPRNALVVYCNAVHSTCFEESESWEPVSFNFPLGRWWRCFRNVRGD